MYTARFGLSELPFKPEPTARHLYRSAAFARECVRLKRAIEERDGIAVVLGPTGGGRKTLCRSVMDAIGGNVPAAWLSRPAIASKGLIATLLDGFRVDLGARVADQPGTGGPGLDPQDTLHSFLLGLGESGGFGVAILDDAQSLPIPILEQIGALQQGHGRSSRFLQIVLVGQPGLDDVLSEARLTRLHLAISTRCTLEPLSEGETGDYLRHRLAAAGGTPAMVRFAPSAIREIHRSSGGIFQQVNLIADRSLVAGMAVGASTIGRTEVRRAIGSLGTEPQGGDGAALNRGRAIRPTVWVAVLSILAFALIVLAWSLGGGG
jgi:general secretion pathway protein A